MGNNRVSELHKYSIITEAQQLIQIEEITESSENSVVEDSTISETIPIATSTETRDEFDVASLLSGPDRKAGKNKELNGSYLKEKRLPTIAGTVGGKIIPRI